MGETIEEYNIRYEEMTADDDLNYKDPGDYLQSAKDATAKLAKIVKKLEKAESEASGAIDKAESAYSAASKEISQVKKDIS